MPVVKLKLFREKATKNEKKNLPPFLEITYSKDFLRSYFFKNEPLMSHELPISFLKIRFSCNQNIGETLTQNKKEKRNGQLIRSSFLKK
jgi:hypothetical protein